MVSSDGWLINGWKQESWKTASCATRPKAPHKAVWSHLASRIFSCTTCWMNGSSLRCGHVSRGDVPLSASLMMPWWCSRTSSMPSGSSASWAGVLHGMGYRSIPTRRASSISAATGQTGLTIRRRMVPRSPSSASPTSGASRGWARTWCDK